MPTDLLMFLSRSTVNEMANGTAGLVGRTHWRGLQRPHQVAEVMGPPLPLSVLQHILLLLKPLPVLNRTIFEPLSTRSSSQEKVSDMSHCTLRSYDSMILMVFSSLPQIFETLQLSLCLCFISICPEKWQIYMGQDPDDLLQLSVIQVNSVVIFQLVFYTVFTFSPHS